MSKILDLFPVPIYINKNFLEESTCQHILECMDQVYAGHGSLEGDAFSSYNVNDDALSEIQKCSTVSNIRKMLLDEVEHYCNEYGLLPPTKITNSWVNIQNKDSSLRVHSHPYSVISAAFYLNADESSSPIEFYSPNPFVTRQEPVTNNKYTNKQHRFESINTGMLVLFPSWLEHGSSVLNSSSNRIVLSFNTAY